MALSKWGMILAKAGKGDPAHIWSVVQVQHCIGVWIGAIHFTKKSVLNCEREFSGVFDLSISMVRAHGFWVMSNALELLFP